MRVNELPLSPSRNVLTIGMPPATEASKLSATPWRSASVGELVRRAGRAAPCWRSPPACRPQARSRPRAWPDRPRRRSLRPARRSPGSPASATGSANQRNLLEIDVALLAARTRARPRRPRSGGRSAPRACRGHAPKAGPRPCRPFPVRQDRLSAARPSNARDRKKATARLTSRREGHDVVQHFRAGFKKAPDVARGLADALLVLDQRDAHMALAVLAEADAGRHRDARLLDQQRREFDAAERRGTARGSAPRRTSRPAAAAPPSRRGRTLRPARRGGADRWRASRRMQSSGPLSAAVAATWIGVKAP